MRRTILASAAAVAVAFAPGALAQTPTTAQASPVASEAQQRSSYDAWPPERQQMYDAWSPELQSYFWTLTPDQQTGWWLLTDDQRTRLYAMVPQQREQAWAAIRTQMSGAAATTSAPMPSAGVSGANPSNAGPTGNTDTRFVSEAMIQSVATDQAVTSDGKVPVCGANEFDNCMNPWEAGERGRNVATPLDHWPGKTGEERAAERAAAE